MIIECMSSRSASNPNFSIALILLAALGSSLFTIASGTLIYRSTGRLIAAGHWVEHTQEVLTTLQTSTQAIDRIDASIHLFESTHDQEQLRSARAGVLRLEAAAQRLKDQTADNTSQTAHADALQHCSTDLTRELTDPGVRTSIPRDHLLDCRQIVGVMSEQERTLLRERTEASRAESSLSLTTDLVFAGCSLAILSIVFGFLLRDAFARRRIAGKTSRMNQDLAASVEALEEQALETQLLTNARDELQLCVSLDQLYACAARCVALLIPGSAGSLGIINNSRNLVEAMSRWNEAGSRYALPETFTPGSCCGLRSGGMRWRRPGASEIHCTHFADDAPGSYLCLPMMAHGETIGVLFLEAASDAVSRMAETRLAGLRQVIQLIAISIASLRLRLELEHQSLRDPLTGLFNRHIMNMTLDKEIARSRRKQSTLAVLMLDVDHFKTFNDRFGHTVGDKVLANVASVLQSVTRTEDFLCRYGGEEFMIILPEISPEIARQRAEQMREAVAHLDTAKLQAVSVTISVGMAFYQGGRGDAADLIRRADEALYWAKHQGRNCVMQHDTWEREAVLDPVGLG